MLKPVDLFNKVAVPEGQVAKFDPRDITQSAEAEAVAKKEEEVHEKNVKLAEAYWSQKAKDKDWDCVIADLSVYRYCGQEIKSDPRRTEAYRDKVIEGLGFKEGQTRPGDAPDPQLGGRSSLYCERGFNPIKPIDIIGTLKIKGSTNTCPT